VSNSFSADDKRWFQEFLANFAEVNLLSDTSARIRCTDPFGRHSNGDQNPSASADLSQNGTGAMVLLYCHSQECDVEAMLREVDLELGDLYASRNGKGTAPNALPGCRLEEYAAAKNVPLDFLTHEFIGLEDSTYYCKVSKKRVPAVQIPYMDEAGNPVATRYRTGLRKPAAGNDTRFMWTPGAELTLYGRNWLDIAREGDYAFIVEGESDCHVGWHYGVPTVGIPGAQNWRDEWAVILDGISLLIVTVEDVAGEKLWEKVSSCRRLAGRLERTDIR
jgi:hypothetical protein